MALFKLDLTCRALDEGRTLLQLAPRVKKPVLAFFFSRSTISASAFSPEQRARIMREVLEDHISPGDLSKKYNISAHSIRDWIKKAGHQLPKSYKRFPKIWCLATMVCVGLFIAKPNMSAWALLA